jgi:hypothetical protein
MNQNKYTKAKSGKEDDGVLKGLDIFWKKHENVCVCV